MTKLESAADTQGKMILGFDISGEVNSVNPNPKIQVSAACLDRPITSTGIVFQDEIGLEIGLLGRRLDRGGLSTSPSFFGSVNSNGFFSNPYLGGVEEGGRRVGELVLALRLSVDS